MGVLMKLLKALAKPPRPQRRPAAAPMPERYKDLKNGFYWGGTGVTALAAGQGFNHPVVGESFYKESLEQITKGPTVYGVNVSSIAVLQEGRHDGEPSIEVYIEGKRCGSLPRDEVDGIVAEMRPLAAMGKPLAAKANISAGYLGGDYSVNLSLSRPLRERKA